MLSKIITKWNEAAQKQKEVDDEITNRLLGVLYRVRKAVASGSIGLNITFVDLGDIDDPALDKFCAKICSSVIFISAAEELYRHGFELDIKVNKTEKKIYLTVYLSRPAVT